jgi:hypothetical protein
VFDIIVGDTIVGPYSISPQQLRSWGFAFGFKNLDPLKALNNNFKVKYKYIPRLFMVQMKII